MSFSTTSTIVASLMAILILVATIVGVSLLDARAATTPNEVVDRFYGSWIELERESAGAAYAENLHKRSTYVSASFGRYVESMRDKGFDGVLCGDAPASFTTDPAVRSVGDDSATVRFRADDRDGYILLVRDEREWWRIDEVDCPQGSVPAPGDIERAPSTQ